ncbi:Uncharacterized protein dnl_45620 [Desulfonema limicola]|uniref:DUF5666 domain-containing protein n=1 Tax=Desulfonema limicola TaxID=45656 RepID=A0A975BBA8_9BACT|nr:Uncharacterized protein dnl_45620 [Desulfonema limicola]
MISILYAFAVQAADVILGTVETIDSHKGEMTVNIIDSSAKDLEQEKTITIKFDPEDTDISNFSTGRLIRVWGSYVNGVSGIFKAQSFSKKGFQGMRNDPTGVRSRLGRGSRPLGRGRGRH